MCRATSSIAAGSEILNYVPLQTKHYQRSSVIALHIAAIFLQFHNNKQAQMCSDSPKRDCNHSCNHRPSTIVTTSVTTDPSPNSQFTIHPLFTETTEQTDWHIIKCDSSFITLHGEIIKKIWLVILLPYTLSLLSDWSACAHTYPPCSLIGQPEWAHTYPPCSLIGQSEWAHTYPPCSLIGQSEWAHAHNHGEIQSKIKTDSHTLTHSLTHSLTYIHCPKPALFGGQ